MSGINGGDKSHSPVARADLRDSFALIYSQCMNLAFALFLILSMRRVVDDTEIGPNFLLFSFSLVDMPDNAERTLCMGGRPLRTRLCSRHGLHDDQVS